MSTYDRAGFLRDLIAAFEGEEFARDRFEVVVVDNGSHDATWDVLADLAAATPVRLLAARLETNRGPAGGRNCAAALSRAEVLAFTDDDCLPQPGWLSALVAAIRRGADIVQGRTTPDPAGAASAGPWARTIVVHAPTPLFETCNIAYRRAAFEAAGGFDEHDPLTRGRPFGEDVVLATRVIERGGTVTFEPEALVHHRYLPATYGQWLSAKRNLVGFPGLARRSAVFAGAFRYGVFLNREHAAFDAALACLVVAAATRRPALAAGALPWFALRWRAVRWRSGNRALRLAQIALGDLVELVSLLEGSARHRRLVL